MNRVGVFSSGIARISYLDILLHSDVVKLHHFFQKPCDAIAGWGLKPSSVKARRYAAAKGLRYISLEDGFLRSLGLGVEGAPQHSLVVDYTGIYYDASRPSDLESLIIESSFDQSLLERARHCMELLRRNRLSKYNHAPDKALDLDHERPRVLVVDQTFADASVEFGGADENSFVQMLDTATAEHPDAEVCVKIHPDVIAGKKKGYLLDAARDRGCCLIVEDVSPWSLLDAVEHVYVVSSQFGFEALLAGKSVSCFGLPFYAGWGLTRDYIECERRGVKRSIEQVFAASYLRYCHYINPYTGQRCELEDTISLISDQKRCQERLRGSWLAVGFSSWKRKFVPQFLGSAAVSRFVSREPVEFNAVSGDVRVLAWASSIDAKFMNACRNARLQLWKMEDGFVRSVGLGADRIPPLSLVIDSRGIYYDASAPSDLEVILNDTDFDPELLERARSVCQQLVALKLSKYNVGRSVLIEFPAGRRLILVPGQVETDASIVLGSPQVKTNLELLETVRQANPDAYIIYKPHPDVVGGGRIGELGAGRAKGLYDQQLTDILISDLLDQVDEVHTMSSLTGFEALLRGVKVVTYGMPFYAGWGLTVDRLECARRTRKLSLNQLAAGTLILYPIYIDPISGDQINVETAIQILVKLQETDHRDSLKTQLYRLIRNAFLKF